MINALIVCVDYSDLLDLSLRHNRHHFNHVLVVTAKHDRPTTYCAAYHKSAFCMTTAFYEDGAAFNKYKAVEQGLDLLGRQGWICVMDADILIPKSVSFTTTDTELTVTHSKALMTVKPGQLFTPLRHMLTDIAGLTHNTIPEENEWGKYPIHPNQGEHAGYMHLFHADDPCLGPAPWYETNWRHAGGADSMFQRKWKPNNKVRPAWNVLHLGNHGTNWCGRVSPTINGAVPEQASQRTNQLHQFMKARRHTKSFQNEKL